MAFYDKWIPKEVKKPFKSIGKLSKKFLPKELRPWLPMASAFMPYTGIMGAMGGAGGFGKMYAANLLSQSMAEPDSEFDDLNQLSALLAGTQGGLMGSKTAGKLADMTTRGMYEVTPYLDQALENRSLLTKAKDLGITGLSKASEYLQGGAETLQDLGSGKAIEVGMTKDKVPIMGDVFSLGGAKEALKAAALPVSHGMGDVAQAYAKPAMREFEAAEAAEAAEYGANEERMKRERMEAIRAGMEENNFSEEEIQVVFDRLGLGTYVPSEDATVDVANGGIIGLRNGGMLNLGGNEMDYRGGGFVPIGKRERADDVPARLSKNEFVMTADAVKAAGGGNINKGAQRMYNVMNNLEAKA